MPMLWIGCASFDVTDSQAKALEQALGDFGLRRVGA
jgi:hypothetical protein